MHKERLNKLFETFDPAVKSVILGVLDIEQEHINRGVELLVNRVRGLENLAQLIKVS